MEPFDVNTEDPAGTTLTPTFAPSTPEVSPADIGMLPDVSQVMGPRPQMPPPPPPLPPPNPMHDPRSAILALAALGMAIGQGPGHGGAGAFQGFIHGQQALEQDQLARWKIQAQQQQRQQILAEQDQRQQTAIYQQRQMNLEKALINFKTSAEKVGSKAEYDALADAYGNTLQTAGYRTISGNWLRANIPYMQPSSEKVATKAFDDWMKNPNNAQLLKENPQAAFGSLVEVDLNGDGVKERIALPQLAEKAGKGFAKTPDGQYITAPRGIAGTSAFDVSLNVKLDRFRAENRREPTPKEKEQLVNDAIMASKEKPVAEEDASVALSPAGMDAAARNYAKTGTLPPMGMSRASAGIRSKIINRAAELYPDLDVAANKAGFSADADALKKLTTQANAVEAFEKTAGANLDRFVAVAKNVADSGVPWVNKPYRQIRRTLLGDPQLAQFDAARLTAQNEIARVLNSANMSGVLSDSARREMEQAISPDATFQQIVAAAQLFKADMQTRRESYRQQIADLQGRLRGQPGAPPAPTPTSARDSALNKLKNR